jgi:predicted amidophosphoribosyltransferase
MSRLHRRGTSLSDEFGRALHDALGLPYEPDALITTVDHIEIKRLAPELRRKAVSGTFAATTQKLAGKSVLLVDDISTSGATVAECAQQLRDAGVIAVFAYTLARTADLTLRLATGRSDEAQIHKVAFIDPPGKFDRWTRNL